MEQETEDIKGTGTGSISGCSWRRKDLDPEDQMRLEMRQSWFYVYVVFLHQTC